MSVVDLTNSIISGINAGLEKFLEGTLAAVLPVIWVTPFETMPKSLIAECRCGLLCLYRFCAPASYECVTNGHRT